MCQCGRSPSLSVCSECPTPLAGPRGVSVGIRVTAESAGANCTYGGYKIETGISSLADGVPDTSVVTTYLCNVGPGSGGATPTFVTGTITTLAPGNPATAAIVATVNPNEYQINIGIPAGEDGVVLAWEIGTVTTLPYTDDATATVTLAGTDPDKYLLNLGIPAGPPGSNDAEDITFDALVIPAAFEDDLDGSEDLQEVIEFILETLADLMTNETNPHGFMAKSTSDRLMAELYDGTDRIIQFSDDSSAGLYDNGNDFFTTKYVCPVDGLDAMRFVAENLVFKRTGTGGGSTNITVEILKNGALITGATEVITLVDTLNVEVIIGAVITDSHIVLSAGDIVTVRITNSNVLAIDDLTLLEGAKFSNSFAD